MTGIHFNGLSLNARCGFVQQSSCCLRYKANHMRGAPTLCLFLFLSCASMAQQSIPGAPQSGPAIQIVEGDGAINSIRLHRGHDPSVRVVSPAGEPIPGATVTFVLPATGPSASFGISGLSTSTVTDEHGVATGRGLHPNG